MSDKMAVKVSNLRKEFILPQHKNTSMKHAFVNIAKKNGKVTQTVLDGISFEVKKGDFFGIVGRNGGGKSTLLRILAGVYEPTDGGVELNGKLTPFIELGVGFNPELSGRDNVFLNGALLGFTRKQMQEMYDEIVSFAELEPFMDKKLKNYSSGMQVRLAFSIAIKAKNEILIFDEVLAVGDEAFQRKCLDVFETYKAEKQTVILVTHDMETVRRFCNRAILIHNGKLVEDASPAKVADAYSALNQEVIDASVEGKNAAQYQSEFGVEMSLKDGKDKASVSFAAGDDINFSVSWKPTDEIKAVVVNLYKKSGEHISSFRGTVTDTTSSRLRATMRPLLAKGKYQLFVQMIDKNETQLGSMLDGPEFTITSQTVKGVPPWSGLVAIDHDVKVE